MDVKYIPDTSREACNSEMLSKKKDRTTELHTRFRFLYDKNNSSPTLSKSHKRNGCYETLCSFTTRSQGEGTSVKIACAIALDVRYNNIHPCKIIIKIKKILKININIVRFQSIEGTILTWNQSKNAYIYILILNILWFLYIFLDSF